MPGLGYKPKHYVFPVDGGASYVDTYGANRSDIYDGWHHGDDLFAPLGTPVVAVARGTLSLVGWNELGGWRLWLTDKKGNSFYYAHLAGYARWILTHHHVRAGQVVGFLGRTGDAFTTTPHLHFEIHPHQPAFVKLGYDGAVDPTTYLRKWQIENVPARRDSAAREAEGARRSPHAGGCGRLAPAARCPSPARIDYDGFELGRDRATAVPAPAELRGLGRRAAAGRDRAADLRARLSVKEPDGPARGRPARRAPRALGGAGAFTFRRRRRTAASVEPAPDASS